MRILIATSNAGKLRDFAAAAAVYGVDIACLPGFKALPEAVEDGLTFEANARKKSEHYSRYAPGELVLADDSGLAVDALGGAPGVYSARYAAMETAAAMAGEDADVANNALLLRKLEGVADASRTGRFVCVLSLARDGLEVASFHGEALGRILHAAQGCGGFGYDPLFCFPALGKSFAELTAEEKAAVSHRGAALRKMLEWARGNNG
jgi:XTP/dITP diphosphohydrolase